MSHDAKFLAFLEWVDEQVDAQFLKEAAVLWPKSDPDDRPGVLEPSHDGNSKSLPETDTEDSVGLNRSVRTLESGPEVGSGADEDQEGEREKRSRDGSRRGDQ